MALARAAVDAEAGAPPDAGLLGTISDAHEEISMLCAPICANSLQAPPERRRVARSTGRRLMTDGPFAETKEPIAGQPMIDAGPRGIPP